MKHRTDQIELKRNIEALERTEKTLEKLEDAHRKLVDTHRSLNVETDYLREDCQHFDEQLKKESELRKLLQHEKKQLMGQLQTVQIEKDTSQLSLQKHQKELEEITQKMVKLDSIVRDTKAAMTKVNLEHQVELKAHTQKVAILERVIADERNERRNLVAETQDLVEKRETSLDLVQKRDLEIAELKRHRLEKEEEADRFRILLKAQEQRNSEQLVIVDKYHAAVASHDAEMRQMHVLLECEREEAQRKLSELQTAYASSHQTLQRKIEGWKLAFEDVLSQLNFNPATEKIHVLEIDNVELKQELKEAKAYISAEIEKVKSREAEITKRDNRIKELKDELRGVEAQLEDSNQRAARNLL
jgi:chromosome segregation ATPase